MNYTVTLNRNGIARHPDGFFFCAPRIVNASVTSLTEASAKVRDYINRHDLGASQYDGGDVWDEHGNYTAYISYNGRIWTGRDCKEEVKV